MKNKEELYNMSLDKEINENINYDIILDPLIKSKYWIQSNNGICFLYYEIAYKNNKVVLTIYERETYTFDMSENEYYEFMNNFENIMYKYNIVNYGGRLSKKCLSTDNYSKTIHLYNIKSENTNNNLKIKSL